MRILYVINLGTMHAGFADILPKKKTGVLKRGTAGSGLANDLKSEGNRAGSFVLAKPLRKVSEKDRAEHEEQRRDVREPQPDHEGRVELRERDE